MHCKGLLCEHVGLHWIVHVLRDFIFALNNSELLLDIVNIARPLNYLPDYLLIQMLHVFHVHVPVICKYRLYDVLHHCKFKFLLVFCFVASCVETFDFVCTFLVAI